MTRKLFITLSIVSLLATSIAVQAMTPHALYQFQIGESARRADKLDIAAVHYQKAIAADPTDSVLYVSLGQVLEQQGDATAALSVYKEGLSYNPQDIMLNALAGRVYELNGDNQSSFEHYKKLVDTKFTNPHVFYFGSQVQQGPIQRQVVKVDPKTGKSNIVLESYFPHNYYGYETFADKPQFAGVFETIGNVYTRMGQLSDAKEAYRVAIKIDPQGKNEVYQKLANIARLEGNKSDEVRAANNYNAYVKLGTANATPVAMTSKLSGRVVASSQVQQSKPLLTATDVTESSSTNAQQLLSNAQTTGSQQQAAQVFLATPGNSLLVPQVISEPPIVSQKYNAVTYDGMLKRLVTEPNNIGVMLSLANMDIDRSDWTESLYYLNQVVMRDPGNVQAYWLAAEAYQGLSEYGKAQAAYEKALSLQPNNTYMQSEYTAVLKRSGEWNAAKQYQDSSVILPQVAARPIDQTTAAQAFPALVPSNSSVTTSQVITQQTQIIGYDQQGKPIIIMSNSNNPRNAVQRSYGNQSGIYVLP